jgi:bla regulator protein blaR1
MIAPVSAAWTTMGPALANHLWQSTLFAVAAGLMTLLFRDTRAQVRCYLWLAASLKFLIPFSLLVRIGGQLGWRTAPAQPRGQFPLMESITHQLSTLASVVGTPSAIRPPVSAATDALPMLLLALWAFGFVTVLAVWAKRWVKVDAILRGASSLAQGPEAEMLRSLQLHYGMRPRIDLVSCRDRLEPGVFGFRRPVLFLPEGISEHLTPAQLKAILAHELCHVRCRHTFVAAAQTLVEAIYWFHPLIWWLGTRLVDEKERTCDEEVLRLGNEPRIYAESILTVCRLYLASPLPSVPGVASSNLRKRIEEIMSDRIHSNLSRNLGFTKKVLLVIAGTASLAVPVLIGVVDSPQIRAQQQVPSRLAFEVAAIKPSGVCEDSGKGRGGVSSTTSSPGRLSLTCVRVIDLIRTAYSTFANDQQRHGPAIPIEKGPAWINSTRYTITAATGTFRAENAPSLSMMQGPMLRALLEDRFKLKIHRETREIPVYALTVAKGGPKTLSSAQPGKCITVDVDHPAPPPASGQPAMHCGFFYPSTNGEGIDVPGTTMAMLTRQFSSILDREVIDKTGIAGAFDLHFEVAPMPTPPDGSPASEKQTLFLATFDSALQKLGLKIENAKGPGEFLVIDSVAPPTEN